jgi:predicted HicB family RNase H-like nuclease
VALRDRIFVGRVINIKDIIMFDGISVDELQQSFHNVIDEYLEDCQKLNKIPNQPSEKELNISLSSNVHNKVLEIAETQGISINNFIEKTLEKLV